MCRRESPDNPARRGKRCRRGFHGKQVLLWYIYRMASDAEWAWAAGIFQGAGTFVTINGGRDLRMALHMVDEDVVRRYAEIVESRVLGPYASPTGPGGVARRPTFRCNLNGRFAFAALARMWPWLATRQRTRCRQLGFEPAPPLSL